MDKLHLVHLLQTVFLVAFEITLLLLLIIEGAIRRRPLASTACILLMTLAAYALYKNLTR
jgi:hypothetical protein